MQVSCRVHARLASALQRVDDTRDDSVDSCAGLDPPPATVQLLRPHLRSFCEAQDFGSTHHQSQSSSLGADNHASHVAAPPTPQQTDTRTYHNASI
jgi:hypothetical protein